MTQTEHVALLNPYAMAYVGTPVCTYQGAIDVAALREAGAISGAFARGAKILVSEEVMDRLVALVAHAPVVGTGPAIEAAVVAASLGQEVHFVGGLADDAAGHALRAWLVANGVQVPERMAWDPTARMVGVEAQGKRTTWFATQPMPMPAGDMMRMLRELPVEIGVGIEGILLAHSPAAFSIAMSNAQASMIMLQGCTDILGLASELAIYTCSAQVVVGSGAEGAAVLKDPDMLAVVATAALSPGKIVVFGEQDRILFPGLNRYRLAVLAESPTSLWFASNSTPRRLRTDCPEHAVAPYGAVLAGVLGSCLAHGLSALDASWHTQEAMARHAAGEPVAQ